MVDMGYRFRIYPNRRQRLLIERTFGCTRWVWNHFLNKRQVEYEEPGRSSRAFIEQKKLLQKQYGSTNRASSFGTPAASSSS